MQPLSLPRVQQVPQQVTTAQGMWDTVGMGCLGASIRMTVLPFLFRRFLLCDMFGSLPGSSLWKLKKSVAADSLLQPRKLMIFIHSDLQPLWAQVSC